MQTSDDACVTQICFLVPHLLPLPPARRLLPPGWSGGKYSHCLPPVPAVSSTPLPSERSHDREPQVGSGTVLREIPRFVRTLPTNAESLTLFVSQHLPSFTSTFMLQPAGAARAGYRTPYGTAVASVTPPPSTRIPPPPRLLLCISHPHRRRESIQSPAGGTGSPVSPLPPNCCPNSPTYAHPTSHHSN